MITPLRGPAAAGWNETLTAQLVDCESVVQLLVVTTNSALSLATALTLTLAAPMFVSVSVSGAPGEWGRIGVSLCDITAGMNALIGIQQALLAREKTGRGSGVHVSLFDSAAELMSVPYLQTRHTGRAPARYSDDRSLARW